MNPKVYFLFYRGTGLISALIRWQSRGPYAHVAIAFEEPSEVAAQPLTRIIEAREWRGVIETVLVGAVERLAGGLPGAPRLARLNCPLDSTAFLAWAKSKVGHSYDYSSVLRFISRRQASRHSSGKWFCSELAFAGAAKFGCELLSRTEPWAVSPSGLWLSPKLLPVCTDQRQ